MNNLSSMIKKIFEHTLKWMVSRINSICLPSTESVGFLCALQKMAFYFCWNHFWSQYLNIVTDNFKIWKEAKKAANSHRETVAYKYISASQVWIFCVTEDSHVWVFRWFVTHLLTEIRCYSYLKDELVGRFKCFFLLFF